MKIFNLKNGSTFHLTEIEGDLLLESLQEDKRNAFQAKQKEAVEAVETYLDSIGCPYSRGPCRSDSSYIYWDIPFDSFLEFYEDYPIILGESAKFTWVAGGSGKGTFSCSFQGEEGYLILNSPKEAFEDFLKRIDTKLQEHGKKLENEMALWKKVLQEFGE